MKTQTNRGAQVEEVVFIFLILDTTIYYYKYRMTFSLSAIVNVVIWHNFYSKATGMSWY